MTAPGAQETLIRVPIPRTPFLVNGKADGCLDRGKHRVLVVPGSTDHLYWDISMHCAGMDHPAANA